MKNMKQAVAELRAKAGQGIGMEEVYHEMETILREHAEELSGISGSYCFEVTDLKRSYSGRMTKGVYSSLAEGEKADVTLSATEATFLSLLSGKLSVMKAMLFGKLKVHGDIGVLTGFAAFIG